MAKNRLIVNMPREDYLDFESYAKNNCYTKGELLRRAYELFRVVKAANAEGFEMLLRDTKDKTREKIVII